MEDEALVKRLYDAGRCNKRAEASYCDTKPDIALSGILSKRCSNRKASMVNVPISNDD
jgi:hypothetical protein